MIVDEHFSWSFYSGIRCSRVLLPDTVLFRPLEITFYQGPQGLGLIWQGADFPSYRMHRFLRKMFIVINIIFNNQVVLRSQWTLFKPEDGVVWLARSFSACLFSIFHRQGAHSTAGADMLVRSLKVVLCGGASVKYVCQLLRLHEKKVPLPTPPASSSTSPCLINWALIREEEVWCVEAGEGDMWRKCRGKPGIVASCQSLRLS